MFLVDSMVTLGAVSKGRSAVWATNQILRREAALAMFWNVKVMMRYIRTSQKCADGPSRGGMIGVMPSKPGRKKVITRFG